MHREEAIAYQNKDVVAKLFGDHLQGKPLSLLGWHSERYIKELLPTNLPVVSAKELRMDNLFVLDDGSLAIVDYESAYKKQNFVKYGRYAIELVKRSLEQGKGVPEIRIMLLYTADINQAEAMMDTGAVSIATEPAYLVGIDSQAWFEQIESSIEAKKVTDEVLMRLMILPLTYKGTKAKQIAIRKSISLACEIDDSGQKSFALAGILTFADKVIDRENRKRIKEVLSMTQIGQMLIDEGREEGKAVGRAEGRNEIALNMLRAKMDDAQIFALTGITEEELGKLKEQILVV